MRKIAAIPGLFFALVTSLAAAGVEPHSSDAASLQLLLRKLTVVGNLLYVGAHPDDENTAVLAYFSNGRLLRTAYLSVTRGDGGQNLIGSEQGDLLGVIRTEELLAARRIDGAEQFFTRAVDFGFSKTAEETLNLWGREEVLSDVVWVIRRFRPDVIISRFTSAGGGHGNHTASAMLAEEAFAASGDPRRFPEQLKWVKPWKAKRLVWNMYNWGRQPQADTAGAVQIDVGDYNPLLGKSYRELAGESRSMHKSQGMGAPEGRGTQPNFFKNVAGDPATSDLLEGIDVTWRRIPDGEAIGRLLEKASSSFQPDDPAAVVPILFEAYGLMEKLEDDPRVEEKKEETLEAIRLCSGLWLEAVSRERSAVPGRSVNVDLTAINRSALPFELDSFALGGKPQLVEAGLGRNTPLARQVLLTVPADTPYTQPYWLAQGPGQYLRKVGDQRLVGLAESEPPFHASFVLSLHGRKITFDVPVVNRHIDPVQGEKYRVFEVLPEVSVQVKQPVIVFLDGQERSIAVTLVSQAEKVSGQLHLALPSGWSANPPSVPYRLEERGETATFDFRVSPSASAQSGEFQAVAEMIGRNVSYSVVDIDYPHIPAQTVLEPAQGKLLRLDLKKVGRKIGYIMGSGDYVPEALREIGYQVFLLSDQELESADLSTFDAIVVGIRAYNTRPKLKSVQKRLLEYVEKGGTVVVQYSIPRDIYTENVGPYRLQISPDRVSVEDAPVTITAPDHPLLTAPNRIGPEDFAGWVQERGLYFPGDWDSRYETLLSCHDPGEQPLSGGVLFARYGKGIYIYTSFAWFRQLPAGVPGAYRIFANMLSARGSNGS